MDANTVTEELNNPPAPQAKGKGKQKPKAKKSSKAGWSSPVADESQPNGSIKPSIDLNGPAPKSGKGKSGKMAPKTSKPFISDTVELKSHNAQMAFKRGFRLVAQSCYNLSVVVRIITSDETAALIETAVDRQFDDIEHKLRAELDRLRGILDERGLPHHTNFNGPQSVTVEITSPRAARYMGIVRLLDDYASVLGVLWISGLINERQFTSSGYDWQKSIVATANRIHDIGMKATAKARELRDVSDVSAQERLDMILAASGVDYEAASGHIKSAQTREISLESPKEDQPA